jgi:hypothetical protein
MVVAVCGCGVMLVYAALIPRRMWARRMRVRSMICSRNTVGMTARLSSASLLSLAVGEKDLTRSMFDVWDAVFSMTSSRGTAVVGAGRPVLIMIARWCIAARAAQPSSPPPHPHTHTHPVMPSLPNKCRGYSCVGTPICHAEPALGKAKWERMAQEFASRCKQALARALNAACCMWPRLSVRPKATTCGRVGQRSCGKNCAAVVQIVMCSAHGCPRFSLSL